MAVPATGPWTLLRKGLSRYGQDAPALLHEHLDCCVPDAATGARQQHRLARGFRNRCGHGVAPLRSPCIAARKRRVSRRAKVLTRAVHSHQATVMSRWHVSLARADTRSASRPASAVSGATGRNFWPPVSVVIGRQCDRLCGGVDRPSRSSATPHAWGPSAPRQCRPCRAMAYRLGRATAARGCRTAAVRSA